MRSELSLQFSDSTPKITFNPDGDQSAEVCIANISPAERKKRLNFAIVQFVIAILIFAALLVFDMDKLWRLPLYFFLSASATSFFQWRDKT